MGYTFRPEGGGKRVPWKESSVSVIDERMRFVIRFKDGETMASLCRILKKALGLPAEARAALAGSLLDRLDEHPLELFRKNMSVSRPIVRHIHRDQ